MSDDAPVLIDAATIVAYNEVLCSDTGENSALLDSAGLDAAVERPWSGFGDFEACSTIYEKAAALLHGIASRQVFENGNKRTAWAAAVALLEWGGVDIGSIDSSHSDMFVRAAALDHSLEISDLADWFRATEKATHGPAGIRLTTLMLANGVDVQNGMVYVMGGALTHYTVAAFPAQLTVVALLVFQGEVSELVEPALDLTVEVTRAGEETVSAHPITISLPFGDEFGPGFPVVVTQVIAMQIETIEAGRCEVRVLTQDGTMMGMVPFVTHLPPIADSNSGAT